MSKRWRRRATILVVPIATGILIWKYAPLQMTRWGGSFDLTVRIESPQPVRKIRLISVSRREDAEETIDVQRRIDAKGAAKVFDDYKWKTLAPYDGQPVQILSRSGGASNQSGYVPHPRVTREITVRLP